jgi:hypothetical protein
MVLVVTMDDFLNVLREIEPSAMRQVFTELPDVTWDQVGGMEEAKAALREAVEWPLRYPELAGICREAGMEAIRRLIMQTPTATMTCPS